MAESKLFTKTAAGLGQVEYLLTNLYIPLAEVEREIPWPKGERFENDAEHSFSLAIIGASLGEKYGLNPSKIALYASFHDIHEHISGDTSLLDDEGRQTKKQREAEAIKTLEVNFQSTPLVATALKAYESQIDEESRFVYALDKLLATMMVVQDGGRIWKKHGLTFEDYAQKFGESQRLKIAAHPLVLGWYEEFWKKIEARKDELFVPSDVELKKPTVVGVVGIEPTTKRL